MATKAKKVTMQWTGNAEADALVASDPTALLIGFCLDQQITVEKAFMGPLVIRERLGTLDAAKIARMSPAKVEKAFQQVPAVHRFPVAMAGRVHALCDIIAREYGNDAAALWTTAPDAREMHNRFAALPGFGKMKATIMVGVVGKHLGVKPPGWDEMAPQHPTLADVHTVGEREAYQAGKRAYKASLRAEQAAAAKPVAARKKRA